MLPLRARVDLGVMAMKEYSTSDCLVSYLGHSLVGGSYPSAEKQSVYSTAPADWAITDKGWEVAASADLKYGRDKIHRC